MFRKILYPTDFSDSARAALDYVMKLKEAGAEEVILLHVYDERDIDMHWEIESIIHETEPVEQAKHDVLKVILEKSYGRLKELEAELAKSHFKTELVVMEGVPYQKIAQTADDMGVSLIVMGSHGERGLVGRVLGSTTGRVLLTTNVPVLVVKDNGKINKGK